MIDKVNGRVLIDNREYTAAVTYSTGGDNLTSKRDASARLADDLARQVVDDLQNIEWKE